MPNGKTYTEVLLEVYDKLDVVEQRMVTRLDSIDKSVQQNCIMLEGIQHDVTSHENRLNGQSNQIDKLRDSAKNAGLISSTIAIVGSTIAAILGTSR